LCARQRREIPSGEWSPPRPKGCRWWNSSASTGRAPSALLVDRKRQAGHRLSRAYWPSGRRRGLWREVGPCLGLRKDPYGEPCVRAKRRAPRAARSFSVMGLLDDRGEVAVGYGGEHEGLESLELVRAARVPAVNWIWCSVPGERGLDGCRGKPRPPSLSGRGAELGVSTPSGRSSASGARPFVRTLRRRLSRGHRPALRQLPDQGRSIRPRQKLREKLLDLALRLWVARARSPSRFSGVRLAGRASTIAVRWSRPSASIARSTGLLPGRPGGRECAGRPRPRRDGRRSVQ